MKLSTIALPGLLVTGLLAASCIPSVDEEEPGTPDGSTSAGSGGDGSGGSTSSSGGASTASGGVTSSGGTVGSGGVSSSGGVSGSGGLAGGSGGTTGAAGRSGGGGNVPTGGRSGLGGRTGAGGRAASSGQGGRSAAPSGQGGRAGPTGTAGSSGATTETFAQVAQILGTSCGVTGCHSDATHTDLRNDAGLYARLVNAAPTGTAAMAACKTMKLVTPNSPGTSVLSQIVKAAVTGCSPARMPDMCSTGGFPRACLSTAQISTIDGWITAGARM